MRALLTGATGFIGAALFPALAARGVETTPTSRRMLADILAGEAPLSGYDAIVHLAGVAHARAPASAHMRVNAEMTIALARRARAAGVRRFVFASSVKALGEGADARPFDDATPPAPQSAYGRSKLCAEQGLAGIGGLEWAALRLPLVHGPAAKGNFAALLRLADSPLPLPFAGIANRRSLISLASAIEAFLAALGEGPSGAFLVCDRPALATADIAAHLRAGLDRPTRLVRPGPASPFLRLKPLRMLIDSFEIDDARFRSAYGFEGRDCGEALRETARAYASARRAR